jgi:N-acetylneuraminic acid mutarotase
MTKLRRFAGVALAATITVALPYGGLIDREAQFDLTAAGASAGWVKRPPVNLARVGSDVVTVAGRIFIFGGFDPDAMKDHVFDSVESRRVDGSGTWRTLTPMPTARANPAAAALGGSIYVAGGVSDEAVLDVVEKLDPATGAWSAGPRLPNPRGGAGAATLDGLLYVAGGFDDHDEVVESVTAFDPRTQSWKSVAPMRTARWGLRLVAAGAHLYAIGGRSIEDNTLTVVERYDPKSNSWRTVAPMNQDRVVPGVTTMTRGRDHLIVVVGGCQIVNGEVVSFGRSSEIYNLATGRWSLLQAQLPHGRCSLGSAVEAGGSVLAISGGTDPNGVPTATTEVDALALDRI